MLPDKKRSKKIARIAGLVLIVAVITGGPAWLYLKVASGDMNRRILSFALDKANQRLDGKLHIKELVGNPLDWFVLNGIKMTGPDGEKVIEVKRVVVSYSIFQKGKFSPRLEIDAENAWVKAVKQEGEWNLKRLRKKGRRTGKPSSYPPVFGEVNISSLEVEILTGPDKYYHLTVPEAAGSFNTRDNTVGFEIEKLTGRVSPPDIPLSETKVKGRAFNTGAGWDVRINTGSLQSRDSSVRVKEGRYFTGTSELEAKVPELNMAPQTLEQLWPGNPLKGLVQGSARLFGDINNIGFHADVRSFTGNISAGGTYTRPENVLDMQGAMNNFALHEFLEADFKLSRLFGRFDLKYTPPTAASSRALTARLQLDSFSYPEFKSFPLNLEMELKGDSYEGSITSASAGRNFNAYISGNIKNPYPFDLKAIINELSPAALLEGQPEASLEGELKLEGSGTSAETFQGKGSLHLARSTVKDLKIESATVDYTMKEGRLQATSARLFTSQVDVDGKGWIEPFQDNLPYRFQGKARLLDPDLVSKLTNERLSIEKADVNVRVAGNRNSWEASGEGSAAKVRGPGVQAESARIKAELGGRGTDRIEGQADLDLAGFYMPEAEQGQVRLPAMDVTLKTHIKPSPLTRPDLDFTLDTDSPDPDYGLVSEGSLDINGKSGFNLSLQKLDLTAIGQEWRLSNPAHVSAGKNGVSVKAFQLEKGNSTIGAFGRVAEENTNFTLVLNRFDAGAWANKLDPERKLEGILSGSVALTGKMSEPELTGSFGVSAAHFQDTRLEQAEGHLKYSQEQFNFSFRGSSRMAGQVRIWGRMSMLAGLSPARLRVYKDKPFELQVDAPDLSVDVLDYFIPWLTELSGKASLYAHVKGTPASPDWNGKTRLMNVSCNVPEWGLSLSGLSGVAEIKENVVRIPEITVYSGDGRARLYGGFRIRDYSVADLDLKLEADNFKAMNTPDINASADADLSLRGDLSYPRFGGKVKFTELTYRPPLILAYQGTSWESPDSTIRIKGEEREAAESSPLLDRGDLDIKVKIPDHARLRNSELNVRFGGELRVRKPPGGFFLLFGDLETHDGWLIFQGKPFRIERGVFTFPAIPVIDPSLDLLASYRVPDYTTYIKVTGTLSEPAVELYSEPPLDPADVLSVILFGRPMNELSRGEEESLAETGGRLAASYAAANLASSLGMALNLDTIVVETGETPEESGVGIGKYVSEKLYLYYFQQFGEEAAEEFRVRYDINKNVSVEAIQDAEGQGGVDVYYTYTY